MDGVQFEENNDVFTSRRILGDKALPTMARALMKVGLAKSQKQAQYWMITVIIVCLAVSVYSLMYVFAPGLVPFAI